MKKKVVLIVAVVVVVAAAAVLGLGTLKGKKNGAVKYRTEILSKGDIEAFVVTTGTLNPLRLVEVGSQVSGKIDKLYVDFNSPVKEGQVLAELDQSLLKAKIDQSNANYLSAKASVDGARVTLDNLQKKYERAKTLFEKKLISYEENEAAEAAYLGAKADVQAAEARLAQAKSQLDSSRVDLAYATIRSPIDGVVINRLINIGQTVAASFQAPKLFEIANDLSKMQVECAVDEADIGKVKEGQKVRFTVDTFPDEVFNGTVNQVRYSPTTTSNVVTYTTIVDVDNQQLKLRPGMTATVSIITGEAKNVLRVPNGALRFTPALPAEEIQKIMKEAGERMAARRQAESGQAPAGTVPASGPPAITPPGGNGTAQGTRARQPSRIWFQDESGKLRVAFIRPGVADASYTEVLRGELREGQTIIIGLVSSPTGTTTQGGQRMVMMGPPPR